MTNGEKSTLLKQWSLLGGGFLLLGAFVGWGINIGVQKSKGLQRDEKIAILGQTVAQHSASLHRLEKVDVRREQQIARVDEKMVAFMTLQKEMNATLKALDKRVQ